MSVKCPYCFRKSRFGLEKKKGNRIVNYCSYCRSEIPRTYVESSTMDYTKLGMIGYSGHGKTSYLISVLSHLKELTDTWDEFYIETLNDKSHKLMYKSSKKLAKGIFPKETRSIFPQSVFLRLNNAEYFKNRFVGFFDTGGALFEQLDLMTRKGRFLTQSQTILFFISLTEKEMINNWNLKIMKLLDRYLQVIYSRYGIKTSARQNILFVFTKSEKLLELEGDQKLPEEIIHYMNNGTIDNYKIIDKEKFTAIKANSDNIEKWLRNNNCNSFINFAKNRFKNTGFVLTSVTGNTDINNNFSGKIPISKAKCVLDPFIWSMNMS